MERICDDNYSQYIIGIDGLIDTTSHSEELSFSTCHICCILEHFDNQLVMDMNMSNRCCDIVFNASISDY